MLIPRWQCSAREDARLIQITTTRSPTSQQLSTHSWKENKEAFYGEERISDSVQGLAPAQWNCLTRQKAQERWASHCVHDPELHCKLAFDKQGTLGYHRNGNTQYCYTMHGCASARAHNLITVTVHSFSRCTYCTCTFIAVRSPKKRSDITDPRLASLSPPPISLPQPPNYDLWGTEYSTRYKSPLIFQYVRGAWMETPQPSPTPIVHVSGNGNLYSGVNPLLRLMSRTHFTAPNTLFVYTHPPH